MKDATGDDVDAVDTLRRRFEHRCMQGSFKAKPEFGDKGLTLGAGTVLFAAKEAAAPDAGVRLLALLRAGYGFPVAPSLVDTVRGAARHWARGEAGRAHIHLAFARLPRLADREAAFRLYLADEIMRDGLSPAALIAALDDDRVEKFDPDQPRVPAGSGRESGQWTSGGGGDASEPVVTGRSVSVLPPASDQPFVVPVFLDEKARNKEDLDELIDAQRRQFGTETPEDDVAHGHPIPVAPSVSPLPLVFSPKPASGGARQPPIGPPDGPSDEQPRLCPQLGPDHGGGREDFDLLYQQYIGTIVNQRAPPVDPRLGYALTDPLTGKRVVFDHCRFSNGNMIDAKGHYEEALEKPFMRDILDKKFEAQAAKQIRAAGGRHVEWWFYEQATLEFAKKIFDRHKEWKGKISVHQKDYPGDAEWPYPPSATWARGRGQQ